MSKKTNKQVEQQTMFDLEEATPVAEVVEAVEALEETTEVIQKEAEAITEVPKEAATPRQSAAEKKAAAKREAEQRRAQWIAEREAARTKYDSLQIQAEQWVELVEAEGDTEEARQAAYEFMYRRYLSGEFDPIKK